MSRRRRYRRPDALSYGANPEGLSRLHESVRRDLREEFVRDERESMRTDVPEVFLARPLRIYASQLPLSARAAPRASRRRADAFRFLRSLPVLGRSVAVCVRRKLRREVLFARGVAGRSGVGVGKRWRRNVESSYRCA